MVIGGPPCQGFSNLGSKDVNDPRNKLWKRYLEVVERACPKVFVIENVERFSSSAEFQLLIDEADNGMISDYELSHGVLLAADYGVAQRRPTNDRDRIAHRQDRPARSHPRQVASP